MRLTLATTKRVLAQLRADPRTIALILVLPCLLIGLVAWMFQDSPFVLDQFGPVLVGIFPLIVMFLVTSVATLRERQSGTLERLMTTPLRKGDFVAGYAVAFALLALLQAVVVVGWAVWLGMDVAGELWLVFVVALMVAILGCTLGLGASALARTEFQAVQMMPAIVLPQLVTCGLLMPREQMPVILEWISRVLPLTYAVDAMQQLASGARWGAIQGSVTVIGMFIVGAVTLGVLTLHRQTP